MKLSVELQDLRLEMVVVQAHIKRIINDNDMNNDRFDHLMNIMQHMYDAQCELRDME